MATLALVNASARTEGTRFDALTFRWALRDIGHTVTWYQCEDYGRDYTMPEVDRRVPGLGFPSETLDMGLNRLWTFPRRLRYLHEETVLLMDPTLIRVARSRPRTLVRLHDLRPLSPFADRYATTRFYRYAMPRLRAVARVLVPTPNMVRQLESYRVPASRIHVVPETQLLGRHADHVERSTRRIHDTGLIRVLYLASDRPYKNIAFFAHLARALGSPEGSARFRFTVVSRLRRQTAELLAQLSLPNLRVIPAVDSIEEIYESSDVLAYPSLYEGFGRPVIEAMAFGLPILANRIPPLTTIVGESGLLLEVGNLEAWVAALRSLEDLSVFKDYATRSITRSDAFSPKEFERAVKDAFDGL